MDNSNFRVMDQDTLTDGKVYVFGIKNTSKRDFKAHDIVYGIGCEVNDGVSLAKFREICETKNNKALLSKKANVYNDERCSWREVCATVESRRKCGVMMRSKKRSKRMSKRRSNDEE